MWIGIAIAVLIGTVQLTNAYARRHGPEPPRSRAKLPVTIVLLASAIVLAALGEEPVLFAALALILAVQLSSSWAGATRGGCKTRLTGARSRGASLAHPAISIPAREAARSLGAKRTSAPLSLSHLSPRRHVQRALRSNVRAGESAGAPALGQAQRLLLGLCRHESAPQGRAVSGPGDGQRVAVVASERDSPDAQLRVDLRRACRPRLAHSAEHRMTGRRLASSWPVVLSFSQKLENRFATGSSAFAAARTSEVDIPVAVRPRRRAQGKRSVISQPYPQGIRDGNVCLVCALTSRIGS
jgi:hypothetical protein